MKRLILRLSDGAVDQLAALAMVSRMSVTDNIRAAIDARLTLHGLKPTCGSAPKREPGEDRP